MNACGNAPSNASSMARSVLQAMHPTQCTDGRTDGLTDASKTRVGILRFSTRANNGGVLREFWLTANAPRRQMPPTTRTQLARLTQPAQEDA